MRNVYPLGKMRWAVKWEEEKQPGIVAQRPHTSQLQKSMHMRPTETYEEAEAPDASVPTNRMQSKQMPVLVWNKTLCICVFVKIMA